MCIVFLSPAAKPNNSEQTPSSPAPKTSLSARKCDPQHKDCLLREFRKLCAMVAENPSYNTKTQIIQDFLQKGSTGGKAVSIRVCFPSEKLRAMTSFMGIHVGVLILDNLEMGSYSCNCHQTFYINSQFCAGCLAIFFLSS